MARLLIFLVFISCVISDSGAQSAKAVELSSEPSHRAVDAEFGVYQAFDVEVAPHGATPLHWHRHDSICVTLGDADIREEIEGKRPVELKLKDGDVRFIPGTFAHIERNLSDQPFHSLTIELLNGRAGQKSLRRKSKQIFPGGSVETLFVRDRVRLSEIYLDPGASSPSSDYEGQTLVVPITNVNLQGEINGWEPMTGKFSRGYIGLLPEGYKNLGEKPARFVTLVFEK